MRIKFTTPNETREMLGSLLSELLFDFNKRKKKYKKTGKPVIVCIGSDLVIYDALGPLCGTMLQKKVKGTHVFGTLDELVTAKNVADIRRRLKKEYANNPVIAIDAAVTNEEEEVGQVIVTDKPLQPGAGADKKLGKIGDFTIMGVTCQKLPTYSLLDTVRLGNVYAMAEGISSGVADFLRKWKKANKTTSKK